MRVPYSMRSILYFTDLLSKDTLIQSAGQLYPKTCLKILSICCQSSYEGMRRYITGSIAKEFDYFICRTCVTFIETGMLYLLIPVGCKFTGGNKFGRSC